MPKFPPPNCFEFSRPNDCPEWKQRFARFRIATKLNADEEEIQVASLIYAMGNQAESIFTSFGLSAEEGKKYDTVLKKYEEHFIPKRNIIHERAQFYQRTQKDGESVEAFIRNLYELAEKCEFAGTKDEQIRDRIVIGLLDKEVSEKLQLTPDLDLAKATATARQSELVKGQIKSQTASNKFDMQEVQKHKMDNSHMKYNSHMNNSHTKTTACGRCNGNHGRNGTCPAYGKKCLSCGKMNHFAARCRANKTIREIVEEGATGYDPDVFLGSIECETEEEPWSAKLKICKTQVEFKMTVVLMQA